MPRYLIMHIRKPQLLKQMQYKPGDHTQTKVSGAGPGSVAVINGVFTTLSISLRCGLHNGPVCSLRACVH